MGKNFDSFYTELISDQRWFELLRHYKDSTIKSACEKVYASLVADGTVEARPMSENRKHVYNILCKNPGDKVVFKNWHEKALEIQEAEKEKEWQPVTGEERARRLAEYQAMLDAIPKRWSPPEMTEVEKKREGAEPDELRKQHTGFVRSEVETMQALNEHKLKVRQARRKYFLSAFPDATEMEVEAYCNKFPEL